MNSNAMMVQESVMFQQREEVISWKLPLVHIVLKFHTGVLRLKFTLEMVGLNGS